MRRRLVTTDLKSICVNEINKLTGKFRRPMHYPFRGITAHRHYIEINRQHIDLTRTQLTFGLRVWFVCPRCRRRCGKLYSDGLCWYCRKCADLHFESQRQRRRKRLETKARQLRVGLGDYTGEIGSPTPPKPYRQKRIAYRRAIRHLYAIEKEYLIKRPSLSHRCVHNERDEKGRFVSRAEPVFRSLYR